MYYSKESLAGSSSSFVNKSKNNLLMLLSVGSIRYWELLSFDWVVFPDLYLFQGIVLLNPCFAFSKNLMLPLIDKVTTGT